MATETCYLNHYANYILSIQKKYGKPGCKLPLCIMVSNDTRKGTEKLLGDNNNFGLDDDQISIVQQGSGVPALLDNNAKFAMDDTTQNIITKPHGHGDIHELLYTSGVAKKWLEEKGITWMCFFQVCVILLPSEAKSNESLHFHCSLIHFAGFRILPL